MDIESLDDDRLLDLYRSLPAGSDLLDFVHLEITKRGAVTWARIDSLFAIGGSRSGYQGPERRADYRLRCA